MTGAVAAVLLAAAAVGPAAAVGSAGAGAAMPGPAGAAVDRLGIGMIGDSLTYQNGNGEALMAARFRGLGYRHIRVNGSNGRTITSDQQTAPGSLTLIRHWQESGFRPYTYVIALGSNNINRAPAFWTSRITQVVDAIGPGHRIVWVDTGFRDGTDPRTRAFNATLRRFAASHPSVIVVHWNSYIHSRPQRGLWEPGNDIHMTSTGYAVRNAYIARVVGPPRTTRLPNAPWKRVKAGEPRARRWSSPVDATLRAAVLSPALSWRTGVVCTPWRYACDAVVSARPRPPWVRSPPSR